MLLILHYYEYYKYIKDSIVLSARSHKFNYFLNELKKDLGIPLIWNFPNFGFTLHAVVTCIGFYSPILKFWAR